MLEKRPRHYAAEFWTAWTTNRADKKARRSIWNACPAHLRGIVVSHVRDSHLRRLWAAKVARKLQREYEERLAAEQRAREARRQLSGFASDAQGRGNRFSGRRW